MSREGSLGTFLSSCRNHCVAKAGRQIDDAIRIWSEWSEARAGGSFRMDYRICRGCGGDC